MRCFVLSVNLLMFVSDASGDHMVETYPSMGFYGFVCCEDRFLLLLYVSLGSRISPSILG